MKTKVNEQAVSPVIGVILMVAITVILAAIIASVLIPMAQNVEPDRSVTVTAKQIGEDIIITYFGGQDDNELQKLVVTVGPEDPVEIDEDIEVGSKWTFDEAGSAEPDPVTVVAVFTDGKEQIIFDGYV